MNTVHDILKDKGNKVLSVGPDDSVLKALELMAEKNVGALLVLDGDSVAGIFSERDYCRQVLEDARSPKAMKVRELMTTTVMGVTPERTTEECLALMTDKRIRHLPVLQNQRVIGVVSIGDIVKKIIAHQQFTISELGNYISAG
ncbi:MAG: CBS domain-containing protein [Candidatus Omnitrophota bacterium]|jgi:CBS domain-containing protein